jgi:predicted PurR-regulated permease PerM
MTMFSASSTGLHVPMTTIVLVPAVLTSCGDDNGKTSTALQVRSFSARLNGSRGSMGSHPDRDDAVPDAGSDASAPSAPPLGAESIVEIREGSVPRWLRISAAAGWRILILIALGFIAAVSIARLRVIVIPLLLALLIAAALAPPARWLQDRGWPPLVATWLIVLTATGMVVGVGWLLYPRFADGFAQIGPTLSDAYDEIRRWFVEGPMALDPATIDEAETVAVDRLRSLAESGFTSQAAVLIEIITAFFLTLVVAFFYIKDGDAFRRTVLRRFPEGLRPRAAMAMSTGWSVLQRYLLGVVVVGIVDAVVIGTGLAIIGVPLVIPIMVLTFLAAFFPLVGAIFAGGVATLLALASGGFGDAVLVLILTVAAQQLDGDIIAPFVYSRAVDLHPLGVLLSLTAGAALAGVMGALLAVPVLAVSKAMRTAWLEGDGADIAPRGSANPST